MPALAADDYHTLKLGTVAIEQNDATAASSLGYSYGVDISENFARELDIMHTVAGGEYDSQGLSGQYTLSAAAAYLVYRKTFSSALYGKVKAGALYEDITSSNKKDSYDASGIGVSTGAGLGLLWSRMRFELEWSILEKKASLLSFGASWSF